MKIFKIFSILIVLLIFLTACNTETIVKPEDIEQIKIELISKSNLPNGIAYTLKLKNHSKFTIAQNNVFISYPIKTSNGSRGNEFKIVAKNNKLKIESGEEVVLSSFAPVEEYENNKNLDIDNLDIEIIGYVDEVKEARRFQRYGGIDAFSE